jgi:hypothetical protein
MRMAGLRLVALGVVLGMVFGVMAGGAYAAGKKKKNENRPAASDPPPAAPSSSSSSSSSSDGGMGGPVPVNATQVEFAKKSLVQAQGDYDDFVTARKGEFEAGEAYQSAKRAVEEDEKALAALASPLREKLKASDSRYAMAVEGLEPAKKKLEEAVASKKADEITFRKYDVGHLQEVIGAAEKPVFAKDSAIVAAQAKLDSDKKVLAAMSQRFTDYLNANPDYAALSKALANAKARVVAARNAVAAP